MKSPRDRKPAEDARLRAEVHTNNLPREARLGSERHARFEREGERPIARNMALIGSLGWLIVVPALLGIAGGVWLDRSFNTGVFWTGALLVAGLGVGCWLAWQRIAEE
jgi:ATP synthase protein I